ncbi:MAG TPA: 3-phosphoshikimate 1-carboxyvinyltransferase [Candidatus Marinimicrobia bacterium]|jgi:3-phosphoshikimate 1-carboxyvinyltransferase|nr:3-phosphoshikimate 1-carboxyvinyltransferase [Candidatus Neomarinimicrobiota bacterium]
MAINTTISLPGDKSISHRVLMLASIADGVSEITNLNDGKDVQSTMQALQACGASIEQNGEKVVITGKKLSNPDEPIDCGNSGTSARLLSGFLSSQRLQFSLTGDASLSTRPMNRIIVPLTEMGCTIESNDGLLPLTIDASNSLNGINYKMPVASAQVKSSILLAGLGAESSSNVSELNNSRDHTEIMLQNMGATILVNDNDIRVEPLSSPLTPISLDVPADPSSASFFIALAILSKDSKIIVRNMLLNPTRIGFMNVLEKINIQTNISNQHYIHGELCGDVEFISSPINSFEVPAYIITSIIDEIPILAVLAVFGDGKTIFNRVEELKFKESNRLQAIIDNLKNFGINAYEEDNSLIVEGGHPTMATVQSFDDHRIAMAFIVLSIVAFGEYEIDNKECINISLPGFFNTIEVMLS